MLEAGVHSSVIQERVGVTNGTVQKIRFYMRNGQKNTDKQRAYSRAYCAARSAGLPLHEVRARARTAYASA